VTTVKLFLRNFIYILSYLKTASNLRKSSTLYERRVEFSIDRTRRIASLDITQTGKTKTTETG